MAFVVLFVYPVIHCSMAMADGPRDAPLVPCGQGCVTATLRGLTGLNPQEGHHRGQHQGEGFSWLPHAGGNFQGTTEFLGVEKSSPA